MHTPIDRPFLQRSVLLTSLALGACSGDLAMVEPEGADPMDLPVVQGKEDVLSSFKLGAQEVKFLVSYTEDAPTEEDAQLVLQVIGKVGDRDYLGETRALEGELTLLEWFHALAPSELDPPRALIDAHEAEALALGRSDLSVRPVAHVDLASAGAPSSVDKINLCAGWMASAIKSRVTPKIPGAFSTYPFLCADGQTGFVALRPPNVSSCASTYTTTVFTAGACVPTFRGTLTPQTGTATFRDGHKTVLNGVATFVLGSAVTLNVDDIVSRIHGKGANSSHTVLSTATSITDNLEVMLAVD